MIECVVFGVPDDKWGECSCRGLSSQKVADSDEAALIAFVKSRALDSDKIAKKDYITDQLPAVRLARFCVERQR